MGMAWETGKKKKKKGKRKKGKGKREKGKGKRANVFQSRHRDYGVELRTVNIFLYISATQTP